MSSYFYRGEPDAAIIWQGFLGDMVQKILIYYTKDGQSAATILACTIDNIMMTPIAELGPLDVQIFRLEIKSDG
jgi:hypothetical protein